MSCILHKTNHFRWILAWTVSGIFVLVLSDGGSLKEGFHSFAANEDEADWTLANSKDVQEEKVDWTLAKNEPKDTKEIEPDWTLARNDGHDQEEADWTHV
ncbi:MAG: hypothetical protein AB7P17_12920 [Nitrospirales bacterium]|nr:hypothetical protein [Nitrospirales bacterium]